MGSRQARHVKQSLFRPHLVISKCWAPGDADVYTGASPNSSLQWPPSAATHAQKEVQQAFRSSGINKLLTHGFLKCNII